MKQRGRKSAAQLAVIPDAPAQFLQIVVPEDFSERERDLWQSIVNSLPSNWFSPGDAPLLMAYCRAIALHEKASRQLARTGLLVKGAPNPLLMVQDRAARSMAMLAVKLRLAQSAKADPKTAGSKATATPQGAARPWAKQA